MTYPHVIQSFLWLNIVYYSTIRLEALSLQPVNNNGKILSYAIFSKIISTVLATISKLLANKNVVSPWH